MNENRDDRGSNPVDQSSKSAYDAFRDSSETARRLLAEERLILGVTERILEQLERLGWTQANLAERLGKSRGFISQLLSGRRNMTLRTLADLAHALDSEPIFRLRPNGRKSGKVIPHPSSVDLGWDVREFEKPKMKVRRDPDAPRKLRCLP